MLVNTRTILASELVSSDFVSIDGDQPVSKLLAGLRKGKDVHALVFHEGELVGLVSDSGLLRNVDVTKTRVSTLMRSVPMASMRDSLEKLARLMRDADVRLLPVIEAGKVKGVVHARDLLKTFHQYPAFENVTAKEMSSPNPVVVHEGDDLGKVVRLLKENNIRKVPVLDKKGNLIGVLKLEDIATQFLLGAKRKKRESYRLGRSSQSIPIAAFKNISVKSIMHEDFSVVSPREKGKAVLKRMADQPNPLIIVSENGLHGIISVQSVLDVFLKQSDLPSSPPKIAITHVPELDEIDKANVESMLFRTYQKMCKILKADPEMHVVYKQVQKAGLRARTEVHITVHGVGKTVHAEEWDWRVLRATKKACDSLENEVLRRFKQWKRGL